MESTITIQFAKGGYALHTSTDTGDVMEVFVSTGKLIKALRGAIDELSLLPKKADDAADAA
jgi:hypothetical protein